MKVLPSILQLTLLAFTIVNNVNAAVSVEYTEEGVLRKEGNCEITFTNFGTGQNFVNSVAIEDDGIKITRLINGNLHLNPNTVFTDEDFKTNIIITQNGEAINDFVVSDVNNSDGTFNLKINNISVCDGLIIKQKFLDEQLEIDNRIFYKAHNPTAIADKGTWGPNNKDGYSVPHIHWKINEGLDDLRKICGIYINYNGNKADGNPKHWQYTISAETATSINSKGCTIEKLSEIVKTYITDIDILKEFVGDNFDIYVVKREGHQTAQTNGIISDTNYIVEYYQDEFSNKTKKILGTIRSSINISFSEFTKNLVEKLGINSEVIWTITGSKEAIGTIANQQVLHLKMDYGNFPGNVDGNISYNKYSSGENLFYAARVYLNKITCDPNLYIFGDNYNCVQCNSIAGYYINDDNSCVNGISIGFTEEGVIRRDGYCDITFVNLGVDHLKKSNVIKNVDDTTGLFSVTINNLINGNIGINYKTNITVTDLYDYINISQGGVKITDYEIKNVNYTSGFFDLKINNLFTCDGLIVKQTFQEKLLLVANRLYYYNIIPSKINMAFDSNHFGPSLKYPFKRIHWKINEGLDDLRKTCGIYMVYSEDSLYLNKQNSDHWKYYLSIDSINKKGCDVLKFFDVIKRNYIDYQYTADLLGDSYVGYVLKREGHVEAHMDGVNREVKNSIEIYQKSCKSQYQDQIICTIKSTEDISFKVFTQRLLTECLNNKNEALKWEIIDGAAKGLFANQIIDITLPASDKKGSLPDDVSGDIIYETMKKNGAALDDFTKIARFVISSTCNDGSYMNEECVCKNCPYNCALCDGPLNCKKCVNEEKCTLEDGLCTCRIGDLSEENDANIICDDDCEECDINGCITCKDEKKMPKDGICTCKPSYYEDINSHQCESCGAGCKTCNNKNSCTTCKDSKASLSDGMCVCKKSFLNNEGTCHVCDSKCGICNEEGCVICADLVTLPDENGNCNLP